jgi:hypothetical protein
MDEHADPNFAGDPGACEVYSHLEGAETGGNEHPAEWVMLALAIAVAVVFTLALVAERAFPAFLAMITGSP